MGQLSQHSCPEQQKKKKVFIQQLAQIRYWNLIILINKYTNFKEI